MKIDLHVHSVYSEDAIPTPKELIRWGRKIGLDGIAITDHNTVRGSLVGRKIDKDFVLPGIEVRSAKGDILGLGVVEDIPAGLSPEETVELIHEKGGIAVAAHPYAVGRSSLKDAIRRLDLDAIEVLNPHIFSRNARALQVCRELGKPMTAGSDAHLLETLGRAYTLVEASSMEGVLEAIRKGRTRIGPARLFSPWEEVKFLLVRRMRLLKRSPSL